MMRQHLQKTMWSHCANNVSSLCASEKGQDWRPSLSFGLSVQMQIMLSMAAWMTTTNWHGMNFLQKLKLMLLLTQTRLRVDAQRMCVFQFTFIFYTNTHTHLHVFFPTYASFMPCRPTEHHCQLQGTSRLKLRLRLLRLDRTSGHHIQTNPWRRGMVPIAIRGPSPTPKSLKLRSC